MNEREKEREREEIEAGLGFCWYLLAYAWWSKKYLKNFKNCIKFRLSFLKAIILKRQFFMKILKWSFMSKMNMVGKHFVDYFFLPQYFFFYVKSVQKMNLSFQFASSNRANVSPFKLTNTIHFCTQLMTNSWIDLKLLYYYSLLPKFGDILSLVYFQENCMVFPLRRDLTSPLKQLPW